MEQAHTQLIAQLNERISAADNTPLYMKFAQTVKNAVRSGILEHGNILPGERDLSQLTGVSRITVRKAMQALEEEGVRAPAVTERKSTISSSIRSKKRAVFLSRWCCAVKNRIRCGLTNEIARKRWHSSWLCHRKRCLSAQTHSLR
jgi:DNA-binding transcriptional regulator YhcF (GntR family)